MALKSLKEFMLTEAESPHNVGDRVHVGQHPLTGELGTVTKTNKFGHTFVKTDSGTEHKFNAKGDSLDKDKPYHKVRTVASHQAAKEAHDRKAAEQRAKAEASDKMRAAQADAHDVAHKDIINKLREHSGDDHLKGLGNPVHQFDRFDRHVGSKTRSQVDPGHFGDLFHKIHKVVSIQNASEEDANTHGVTHFGRVGYEYEHPGGGSNGHDAYSFTRHSDGSIKMHKPTHVGTDEMGYDKWDHRKHFKTIP